MIKSLFTNSWGKLREGEAPSEPLSRVASMHQRIDVKSPAGTSRPSEFDSQLEFRNAKKRLTRRFALPITQPTIRGYRTIFFQAVSRSFVIAGLAMTSLISNAGYAQSVQPQPEPAAIVISDCGVHLIDHVVLASDRLAILGKIDVKEGDLVEVGQLVAQLRNEEQLAEERRAFVDSKNDIIVRMAVKNKDVAKTELDLAHRANKNTNVLTEQEMLRVKLALDKATLEEEQSIHEQDLKVLEHAVALAKLKAHDFCSPIKGVVVKKFKSVGEALQQGDPVMEIVNVDRLKIEAFVPMAVAQKIRVGAPVEVSAMTTASVKNKDAPILKGTIQFIDVVAQPVTEEVRIWAEVDNEHRVLYPGLRAQMRIMLKEAEETPVAAVGKN
jgi:biotin carboxyl carrier protein